MIRYQVNNAHDQRNAVTPASNNSIPFARCLSPEVATFLTTRLDPEVAPSRSIRAVFGRHLPLLYRLDAKWTVAHLDQILPEADDLQSIHFFIAAWDSYVVSNWYNSNPQFMNHLRPKYYLAITYLARGHVTKSSEVREGLADHLVMDYLQGTYAIDEPISQQNLLRKFFVEAGTEASSRAAWAAWRFCADHPQLFWPRVKALWTWRLQEVAAANDLAPYQHEMGYFARLPAVIYALESMASLRDLLMTTLKCLSHSGPDYGAWEASEEFLAHKVAEEPVAVIEFYQMMCDHQADPYRLRPNDTRRQILTAAAEQEVSHAAALAISGSIAKLGEHGYKDIYDRFA